MRSSAIRRTVAAILPTDSLTSTLYFACAGGLAQALGYQRVAEHIASAVVLWLLIWCICQIGRPMLEEMRGADGR